MTLRTLFVILTMSWSLTACANDDNPAGRQPENAPSEEETPDPKMISGKMRVKIAGEDLYISAKLNAKNDILYWFKKCMFNQLYTFYRVGTIANNMPQPTNIPDATPSYVLNLSYSDNIGPFNITGHGWCGGNHPYIDEETQTAHNVNYQISLDGKITTENTLTLVDNIQIRAINHIMNPAEPETINEKTVLNNVLCIETVDYNIQRNNIQVTVSHEFQNEKPVIVQMYYGMQSMFEKETHTLTVNGKYADWTLQEGVSTFNKKEFPLMRCFIEKNADAYQSSYLFDEGLGKHTDITDDDIIFIGNSNGKTYHKIIANKSYKKGDIIHWSGVYTWFKSPIIDDVDLLCYEGMINNQRVLFIDCKKKIDKQVILSDYVNLTFKIKEKSASITIPNSKIMPSGIKVIAEGPGSCILILD